MNIQRKMDFNLIVISLPQLMSKKDKSVTGVVTQQKLEENGGGTISINQLGKILYAR